MLILSKSSEFFGERTFHCFIGEFWSLPLLATLLALPDHGYNWGRFTVSTLISGYPYFHPIVSAWISENTFDVKKRAITAATYNVIVQVGSVISSREFIPASFPKARANWVQRYTGATTLRTIIRETKFSSPSVPCR
jgi:hypothetical protein